MANLGLNFEEVYKKISRFLGWGEIPTDEQLRIVKDIFYRGYRQFLYPVDMRTGQEHLWSFLKQFATLNIQTNKWKYALPEDFSELLTDPSFDDDDGYYALTKVTPEQLLELRVVAVQTHPPAYYAIVPASYGLEVGTYYEMWLHGEPDSSYLLQMFYKIDPLKPETTTDYLVGGVKATEAILENCFAIAETQEDGAIGIHSQLAAKMIQDLIAIDNQIENKNYLGNLYSGTLEGKGVVRGENARMQLSNIYYGEGTTFTE